MGETKTYDELLEEMFGRRKDVIETLHFYNGKASIPTIRDHRDIPNGTVYNLLYEMADWGIVEKVDQDPVGRGGPSDIYQLTDLGHAVCEAVVSDDSTTVDDVENLSKQIENLTETVEAISAKIDTHREIIKDHEEDLDELDEDYEEIEEKIDGPLSTVAKFIEQQEDTATQS